MATSRRTGTNEQISTYGGVGQGRDYTVLNTWENDTDIDLVTATQSEVLECYDDETSFDDNVDIANATTSTDYFRIIRPAGTIGTGSWQGHDGTPNNGFYILHTADALTIEIGEANSSIQDLIIEWNTTATTNRTSILTTGGNNLLVGVISKASINSSGDARAFSIRGDSDKMINCLSQDCDRYGVDLNADNVSQKVYAYNCTCVNNGEEGIQAGSGTDDSAVAINCIADGNGGVTWDDFENLGNAAWDLTNSKNNASGDASASGFTNGRGSQTFTFVNPGNDDWHLTNADAGARTYGADLSADGAFAFDDDIDGDIRT